MADPKAPAEHGGIAASAVADPFAALARGMEAGGDAVSAVLARLFSPAPISIDTVRHSSEPSLGEAAHRIGVGFDVSGEARARLMLVSDRASATRLASALLRRRWGGPDSAVDQDAREALAELGNILASSFLNGLARRARMVLLPSVPTFAEDTAAQSAALRLHREFAYAVQFRVGFPDREAEGLFLAAPESDAVESLRRSLAADLIAR